MNDKSLSRAGWTLSALLALFLLPASVAPKLLGMQVATDALIAIGWSVEHLLLLGLIELLATLLILLPRTALLGAVLMTGLLGGAMASHLRAASPLFSHTLFGLYLGLLLWTALWLREPRLRELFPLRDARHRAERAVSIRAPRIDY